MRNPKKISALANEKSIVYRRARWKHLLRWVGMLVLLALNISLIASSLESRLVPSRLSLSAELSSYMLVLFFDVTMLLPILLEVDSVQVSSENIIFRALCWQEKRKWQDILAFHDPPYLKFALVRTPRCVYFLNRRDLESAAELFQTINFKREQAVKEK